MNTNVTLTPNIFVQDADIRQSTWHQDSFTGSIIARSDLSNCQFLEVNMKSSTLASVSLDETRFVQCSLKNVSIESSNIEGLMINGHRIDKLLPKEGK